MLRWFGESFEIIFSAVDQQQLVNPWQRATQVIASLDYAKQEDVRERVWQQHWDLIIVTKPTSAALIQNGLLVAATRLKKHTAINWQSAWLLMPTICSF